MPKALLEETAKYPQYGELVNYLTQREMMPPIEQRFLGSARRGQFRENGWGSKELPKTGVIEVNYGAGPSTVLHELTHAADKELDTQYYQAKYKKSDLTPQEQQFLDAYVKLSKNPTARNDNPAKWPRLQLANKLSPEWAKEENQYRATMGELPAWGMGSTVQRDRDYNPPLHLDPTMATEFLILMDLARRAKK